MRCLHFFVDSYKNGNDDERHKSPLWAGPYSDVLFMDSINAISTLVICSNNHSSAWLRPYMHHIIKDKQGVMEPSQQLSDHIKKDKFLHFAVMFEI